MTKAKKPAQPRSQKLPTVGALELKIANFMERGIAAQQAVDKVITAHSRKT